MPIERRLREVMPDESPIDLQEHANLIAALLARARAVALENHARHERVWLSEHPPFTKENPDAQAFYRDLEVAEP